MRLTVKERILLHLLEFARFADALDVPPQMTQEGLASSVGISVAHVAQYVRPMMNDGLVRERVAHVKQGPRRRKVYDLANAGQRAAIRLREDLRTEVVRIREGAGTREMTIGGLQQELGTQVSLLDIVRQATESGFVNLADLTAQSRSAAGGHVFVDRLADAPRLKHFVGRRAELQRLTSNLDGTRVFVIRGVAGIGKSCLAARACEFLRNRRSLFWHRVRPWDTRQSILAILADFLASQGLPALRSILSRSESSRVDDVLRRDLPNTKACLVFDDAHVASREVVALLGFFRDVIEDAHEVQMIVLTRRKLPFYDRRHVVLGGLVEEIDLGGLELDDIVAFMGPGEAAPILVDIGMQLGGHPLSLELLRTAAAGGRPYHALGDIHRFIEEEIYAELSGPERQAMKTASLFRVPVPWEVLRADPEISYDVLQSLEVRALLRRAGDDGFEAHDTIRDFFDSVLTHPERESLGAFVLEQLLRLAEEARASRAYSAVINYLSNALEILAPGLKELPIREALGDAHDRIGDMAAALDVYRGAMRVAGNAEDRARLHRKIATAFEDRGEVAAAGTEIEAGQEALGDALSPERGWFDLIRCRIAYRLVDWDEAREHGESALDTFRAFGQPGGQARALLLLGYIAIHSPSNDPGRAEHYLREAATLSESLDDIECGADIRIALAHLFSWHLNAVELGMQQIAAVERMPGAMALPHVRREFLFYRATSSLEFLADFDASEASFRQVLEEGQRIRDATAVAVAKSGLAYVAYFRGHLAEAMRGFEEASAELKAQGLVVDAVNNLLALAECSFLSGDLETLGRIMASLDDPNLAAAVKARSVFVRLAEGYLLLAQGDRDQAYDAITDAIHHAEAPASVSAAPLTFGFVACINDLTLYANFYGGVALRFMGQIREGEAHVAKSMEMLKTYGLKARLEKMPILARRLTEILEASQAAQA